jgi:hypothetical protein
MTDEKINEQCAVWYMRYGASSYELCDDEREAVRFAHALEEAEDGVTSGVQFADGRLIERDVWQALADYAEKRYREWRDAVSSEHVASPAPTRQAQDPFDGQSVSVDAGDPDWLGS